MYDYTYRVVCVGTVCGECLRGSLCVRMGNSRDKAQVNTWSVYDSVCVGRTCGSRVERVSLCG